MNYLDNITLEYFTNRTQYETILKKNDINNDKYYTKNKKFYKKRILDLTKRLFRDELEEQDKQLKSIFDSYVKSCINYLQFLDKRDIMQDKYDSSDNNINTVNTVNTVNTNSITIGDNSIIDINKHTNNDCLLFKKEEVKKVNLDNYVIHTNKIETPKILPKKQEINLKSKKYKTKGIKPSSKNKATEKIQ